MPESVALNQIGELRVLEDHTIRPMHSLAPAYEGQDLSDMMARVSDPWLSPHQRAELWTVRDVYLSFSPGLDGVLMTSDGRVIEGAFTYSDPARLGALQDQDWDTLRKQAVPLRGPIFHGVDGAWWSSWFHWIALTLMRYAVVDPHLDASVRMVLPHHRPENRINEGPWRDSFNALELSRPIEVLETGFYHLEELCLLQPPLVWAPTSFPRFREAGARARRDGIRNKVYVTRRFDPRLTGDESLLIERVAGEFGFTSVALEDYEFADELSLFANATHIAGAHGAGLTNMVYTPPGAQILEFTYDMEGTGELRPFFGMLAGGAGHTYRYLNGSLGDFSESRLREAFARMG